VPVRPRTALPAKPAPQRQTAARWSRA